jgi:hypothetical protein
LLGRAAGGGEDEGQEGGEAGDGSRHEWLLVSIRVTKTRAEARHGQVYREG